MVTAILLLVLLAMVMVVPTALGGGLWVGLVIVWMDSVVYKLVLACRKVLLLERV